MVDWPWRKHRQEVAELHEKLKEEAQQAEDARVRTIEAVVDQADSRSTSSVLLRQIQLNGWTELLQAAWGGRT